MKKIQLLFVFILTTQTLLLFAQERESNFSIELNFGRAITNTFLQPIDLVFNPLGGYVPEIQKANFGNQAQFLITRRLKRRNQLGISIGYSEYAHYMSGYIADDGFNPSRPFDYVDKRRFFNTGIVYKIEHRFDNSNKLVFVNQIGLNHGVLINLKESLFSFKYSGFDGLNFRYSTNINYAYNIDEYVDVQIGLYYSMALNKYRYRWSKDYMPYALGIHVGWVYRI